jgi:hypothetical protein
MLTRRRPFFLALFSLVVVSLTVAAHGADRFQMAREYGAGNYPNAIVSADFNRDGFLDVAVANQNGSALSVFLGSASGFGNAISVPVGESPNFILVADFNHDGNPDLAVINHGNDRDTGTVSVLIWSTSANTFKPFQTVSVGGSPNALSAFDLNHDGHLDLVVSDQGNSVVAPDVEVFLADRTGHFGQPKTINGGPFKLAATQDFTADGFADLLLIDSFAPQQPTTMKAHLAVGNGDGTFSPLQDIFQSDNAQRLSVAVTDFDRDGNADVLIGVGTGTGSQSPTGEADILFAPLVGDFQTVPLVSNTDVVAVNAVDCNGDLNPDVVLVVANNTGSGVEGLINSGSRTFQPPVITAIRDSIISVVPRDLNGDGKIDLVVNGSNVNNVIGATDNTAGIDILLGRGDGGFNIGHSYLGTGGPLVADRFLSQQKVDVVQCDPLASEIELLPGNGDGTFQAQQLLLTRLNDVNEAIAVADLNADGNPDVIIFHTYNNPLITCQTDCNAVAVFLSDGQGGFLPPVDYVIPGSNTSAHSGDIKIGDFNHDNIPDFAIADASIPDINIFLGNGGGSFRLAAQVPVDPQPTSLSIIDFNRDRNPDLAVSCLGSQSVNILSGSSNGTFTRVKGFKADFGNFVLANGTFRHAGGNDRHAGGNDLAVANCGTNGKLNCEQGGVHNGSLTLALDQNSTFQAGNLSTSQSLNSVDAGDFNGDGYEDLAAGFFGDQNVGGVLVNLNNAGQSFQPAAEYVAGQAPYSLHLADLNGDGVLDIVVANLDDPNGHPAHQNKEGNFLLGNLDGTFNQAVSFRGAPSFSNGQQFIFPSALGIADVNADGAPDVVMSSGVLLLNTGGTTVNVQKVGSDDPGSDTLVTLQSSVRASLVGVGDPTGDVQFIDDSTIPPTQLGTVGLNEGVAQLQVNLSPGEHIIEADYLGDGTFNPHKSSRVAIQVISGASHSSTPNTRGGERTRGTRAGGGVLSSQRRLQLTFIGTTILQQQGQDQNAAAGFDDFVRHDLELPKPKLRPGIRGQIPTASSQALMDPGAAFFGFNGLTHRDSREADNGNQTSVEPPDQALAVGPTQVLEAVNDVVAVYTKQGVRGSTVSLNKFFGLPSAKQHTIPPIYGPFVTDPRALYDADTGRWFVTALEINTDSKTGNFVVGSSLLIAVSTTGDARGPYNNYRLDLTNDGVSGCPCVGDQPQLGVNKDGLFVTSDQYLFSDFSFNEALIIAIDKFGLAQGSALTAVSIGIPPDSDIPGFAIQPAITPNAADSSKNNGTEYLMNGLDFSDNTDNQLALWAIMNTATLRSGTPDLRILGTLVNTESYGTPPPLAQMDGFTPLRNHLHDNEPLEQLDSDDDRLRQMYMQNGALFTALTTQILNRSGLTAGIAWFVVTPKADLTGVTGTVDVQGYINSTDFGVMYPAIAVNRNYSGIICYNLSSATQFPTAAYSVMSHGSVVNGIHVVAAGALPEDGFSGYYAYGGDGIARWGDYSAAALGPTGDLWFATEYIPMLRRTPLANWGTFIGSFPSAP